MHIKSNYDSEINLNISMGAGGAVVAVFYSS